MSQFQKVFWFRYTCLNSNFLESFEYFRKICNILVFSEIFINSPHFGRRSHHFINHGLHFSDAAVWPSTLSISLISLCHYCNYNYYMLCTLQYNGMYQAPANGEAPPAASENLSRKAEIVTTTQTEKLELTEELAGTTAPEEELAKAPKQPATVRRARGPFDATQSTSTSDVAAGHVDELQPQLEPQTPATHVQRSPERRCVQCTKAHAWMSAGLSAARDGNIPETTRKPEAPREPQTHPKRQHLLATRCTPAVRERVAHVRSSQASPADGSNSIATTSANGQGVEAALRATWTPVAPVAAHSASATPPPAMCISAKPAITSDQVRDLSVSLVCNRDPLSV